MPDVVADSSPLQYLHRISHLDLLHQSYGSVVVPEAVALEIEAGSRLGANVSDLSTFPWIDVEAVSGRLLRHVATFLGRGEYEAIQLALEKSDPLLLLDDREARREARRLSIPFTGVLGILLDAKHDRVIASVAMLLDALQQEGFYLDRATRQHVLHLAGEVP